MQPGTSAIASRWKILLAGGALVVAGLLAYSSSFSGPFVFDDQDSIVDNPTIRRLAPPWRALNPPHEGANGGITVSGRPVLNFSFALNYAVSGPQVWSYHAANLAVHLGAALLLFGIVRRTLLMPAWRKRGETDALPIAWLVALLWMLHPLQTESVTYVVQRAESLMGLFFLLTLYAFIRSVQAAARFRWQMLAFVACALGMATKEVMVGAPLLVLLYDRTFCAGDFRTAWRQRGGLHLALMTTWLLLAALVVSTGGRGASVAHSPVVWQAYALTQAWAVVRYLGLALWPRELVFDYGTPLFTSAASVAPQLALVGGLACGTLVALRRWPVFGFLGAWLFVILAPTSSFVAVATQTIAEHRMYLPLAAVIALGVAGLHAAMGRRSLIAGVALAIAFGALTAHRNRDYHSELRIWSDTVAKRPANGRARNNLGKTLLLAGQLSAAAEHFIAALHLDPTSLEARSNLGNALLRLGRRDEALADFEAVLRQRPDFAEAHYNLGNALFQSGEPAPAIPHFESALRLRPDLAEAHTNLGNAFLQLGRAADALAHHEAALRLQPEDALAHYNLGNTLLALGRAADAVPRYEAALRLRPDFADAHNNLGAALEQLGRLPEARAHYQAALHISPDFAGARANLERLQAPGR